MTTRPRIQPKGNPISTAGGPSLRESGNKKQKTYLPYVSFSAYCPKKSIGWRRPAHESKNISQGSDCGRIARRMRCRRDMGLSPADEVRRAPGRRSAATYSGLAPLCRWNLPQHGSQSDFKRRQQFHPRASPLPCRQKGQSRSSRSCSFKTYPPSHIGARAGYSSVAGPFLFFHPARRPPPAHRPGIQPLCRAGILQHTSLCRSHPVLRS